MSELLRRLETAVLNRNPALAGYFQPGLKVEKIKKQLESAEIEGAIDPIIELYSWKNGAFFRGRSEALELGLVPPMHVKLTDELKNVISNSMGITQNTVSEPYHLVELKRAIIDMESFKEYAKYQPRLSILVGRYFPFLWNGSSGQIALDITPSTVKRVVVIESDEEKDKHPLREGYGSFKEFLEDAIRANETNEPLACLRNPGQPIVDQSRGRS